MFYLNPRQASDAAILHKLIRQDNLAVILLSEDTGLHYTVSVPPVPAATGALAGGRAWSACGGRAARRGRRPRLQPRASGVSGAVWSGRCTRRKTAPLNRSACKADNRLQEDTGKRAWRVSFSWASSACINSSRASCASPPWSVIASVRVSARWQYRLGSSEDRSLRSVPQVGFVQSFLRAERRGEPVAGYQETGGGGAWISKFSIFLRTLPPCNPHMTVDRR